MKPAMAHLSAAAVVLAALVAGAPLLLAGGAAFLGPLAARLALRDPFARRHAAAALRFNLSLLLYLGALVAGMRLLAGSPYTVQLVPFALFVNLVLVLNWLIFMLVGARRAATGQTFTYPLTLRGI
jgi:uncharacterized Tic20 family protein